MCIAALILSSMYYRTAFLQKVRGIPDEFIVFIYKDETKKMLLARVRVSDPSSPYYPTYVYKPYCAVAASPNFISTELHYVWSFLQERAWFSRLGSYNNIVCAML